jgi:hypothetical protein
MLALPFPLDRPVLLPDRESLLAIFSAKRSIASVCAIIILSSQDEAYAEIQMNLLSKLFRRPCPVSDPNELTEFIDAHAAFVTQKGIYEYSRARAGHYSKVLFSETAFQKAVEESRWRAYPLGLAMVAEIATVVLLETTDLTREVVVREVSKLTLAAFDRYDVPAVLNPAIWSETRAQLVERLHGIALHPPKRAMDIPEPFAKDYFALMPIHENLRGEDFPTLRNYLKVTLCNVHHELTKRSDAKELAARLGN